jgi:hypothetical protein
MRSCMLNVVIGCRNIRNRQRKTAINEKLYVVVCYVRYDNQWLHLTYYFSLIPVSCCLLRTSLQPMTTLKQVYMRSCILDVVIGCRNVHNRQRETTLSEKLYVEFSHLRSLICNRHRETALNNEKLYFRCIFLLVVTYFTDKVKQP